MKYNKPDDVYVALESGSVKESSLKQYISRLKGKGLLDKVVMLEQGLNRWKQKDSVPMCTYYNKPIDDLSLVEILDMYDKDKRLLTTSHCMRFTILMIEDSSISIKNYNGMIMHPRDMYLEEE